ncbi:tripartite tricarboxylate transporter TctB family protein [Faunimonas sp. B44]|uniref:tripartite tricarboxylate transporter TctB family protein n=1 Tax=Faunimonas sp. B44 TaxID=3461493 RepID=UPI0040439F4A
MRRTGVRGPVDVFSGLLLAAIAVAAMIFLRDLEVGTARQMGPGYFPIAISLLLLAIGVFLIGRGLVFQGAAVDRLQFKPVLFVSLSLLAFALLIDRAGLVVTIVAQVAIAMLGSPERAYLQSLAFAVALAALSSVVFVRLLGVPVEIFP